MSQKIYTAVTVAPYCIWMALMMLLPQTAATYAVRSTCTAVFLLLYLFFTRPSAPRWGSAFGWGSLVGILVALLWVLPENSAVYRTLFIIGGGETTGPSPYHPAVCGWALTLTRLIGSAFVIAAAEELFFRDFLYRWLQNKQWSCVPRQSVDFSAFLWMCALFALEHDRWLAGALAGALYGLLYIRKGLAAAIVAHTLTNLGLGLYVIFFGKWGFW